MELSHYQVFPVLENTYQGIALNEPIRKHRIVRAVNDGNITFNFPNSTKVVAATAGEDYLAGDGCESVTSTSNIMMS